MINRLFGKKRRRWFRKGIIILIIVSIMMASAIAGSGIASVIGFKNALVGIGEYLSQLSGKEPKSSAELQEWMETVSAEELLGAFQNGYTFAKTESALLKVDTETFTYLLQKVIDYENQGKKTRTVTVEGYHEYMETETTTDVVDGQEITSEESYWTEEIVTKEITVSNVDTEGMLSMNWRMLYVYSLLRSINRDATVELDAVSEYKWEITKADIDAAFRVLSMKYSYVLDVVRNEKTYYSYDECQEIPHVPDTYDDGDGGTYKFNYPRSLMSSAVSGYSRLSYLVEGNKIVGIQEIYDRDRFEQMGRRISSYYSYDFFCQLIGLMPGGGRIIEKFQGYQQLASGNNNIIYTGYFTLELGSYSLPDGVTDSNGIYIPGTGGIFTGNYSNIGEAAVALARSRISWSYSQERRMATGSWDCSSMICRVYSELGLDINPAGDTLYLKGFATAHNQKISESDLMPGDLLWYTKRDGSGRHVMMYAGSGNVIHAKGKNYGTLEEPLVNTGYYNFTANYGQFCFRPYLNVASSFRPNEPSSSKMQASEFLEINEREAAEIILKLAVEDSKHSKILPSITAAQMILESGFVKSSLSQASNNCFGMKIMLSGNTWGGSTWDGVRSQSWDSFEEEGGTMVKRKSSFRVYDTVADSIADHSAYLLGALKSGGPRYAGISQVKTYPEALDILVQGGYATDSKYKTKLTNVVNTYNLDRYDTSFQSIATEMNEKKDGEKLPFSNFKNDQYAKFSKINSGAATYYKATNNSNGKVVCINAGHGTSGGASVQTQSHPDGTGKYTGGTNAAGAVMSTAISTGTVHKDGVSEASVNLKVALAMKDILLKRGYDVVMIRESSDVQLDNIARTVIANNTSNCHVAVHFDGTKSEKGCFYMKVVNNTSFKAMEPVKSMWQQHDTLGAALVEGMVAQGIKKYGSGSIDSDLTQTSYSTIPSVDIEYGDCSSSYSAVNINKIATGLCDGIDIFFGN